MLGRRRERLQIGPRCDAEVCLGPVWSEKDDVFDDGLGVGKRTLDGSEMKCF